jgi:hypothetical protein
MWPQLPSFFLRTLFLAGDSSAAGESGGHNGGRVEAPVRRGSLTGSTGDQQRQDGTPGRAHPGTEEVSGAGSFEPERPFHFSQGMQVRGMKKLL